MELKDIDLKILSCNECTDSKVTFNPAIFDNEIIFINRVVFSIDGLVIADFYDKMFKASGVTITSALIGDRTIPMSAGDLESLEPKVGDHIRLGDNVSGYVHKISSILAGAIVIEKPLLITLQNFDIDIMNTEINLGIPIDDGYITSTFTIDYKSEVSSLITSEISSSHVIYCRLQKCFDSAILKLSTSITCCDDLEYINEMMVLDSILAGLKTSTDEAEVNTLMSVSDRLCSFKSCASC